MPRQLYEETWLFDLVHAKEPDGAQIAFYERQIERYGQPVLELAVGTGNYLVTLSEQNYDISGADKFAEMLDATREKADTRQIETNLYNADMRDFNLDQKFNLIFIAENALQHLKTTDEVISCFASVKRHLAPGGRFVVEVFNPSIELLNRDPNRRYFVGEYKSDDGWIVLETNVRYDPATQINHIDWHYKNQYFRKEQTVSFTMRQFFPQELDVLFRLSGFRIEAKYGNFDESIFYKPFAKANYRGCSLTIGHPFDETFPALNENPQRKCTDFFADFLPAGFKSLFTVRRRSSLPPDLPSS